eukprot:7389000-Prymnesium_polylepis.1
MNLKTVEDAGGKGASRSRSPQAACMLCASGANRAGPTLLAEFGAQLVENLVLCVVHRERTMPQEAEVAADAHLQLAGQLLTIEEILQLLQLLLSLVARGLRGCHL